MDMSVCVLVVLAVVLSGVNAEFVCNRDITQCKTGSTCNTATHKCDIDCPATHQGAACNAQVDACAAPSRCMNGGTCYNEDVYYDKCLCTDNFMGPYCTDHRYKLQCDTGKMTITITPQVTNFTGKIYVSGKKATAECTFLYGAPKDITHTNADCGDADESASPNKVFTRELIVQYNNNALMPTDEVVTFKCPETAGVTLNVNSVNVNTFNSYLIPISKNHKAVASDVEMAASPTNAVNFGSDVTITLSLTQSGKDNGFQDLNIMSCEAGELVSSPTVHFKLIDDHCPMAAAYGVLKNDGNSTYITRSTASRSFIFKAFQPSTPTEVFSDLVISCTVIVCQNLADCSASAHNCTTGNEANGRRKRESGTKETHLNVTLAIRNPMFNNQATRQQLDDKACYQTWEMNVTLAVLGVGLVLVLVVCLVLAVKLILHRKSETGMGKC